MPEKMQTDDVLSRQAVFVRCCLKPLPDGGGIDLPKMAGFRHFFTPQSARSAHHPPAGTNTHTTFRQWADRSIL